MSVALHDNLKAVSEAVRSLVASDHSSGDVAALIPRVADAHDAVSAEILRLTESASDPLLPVAEADAAAADVMTLNIHASRLTKARALLRERLTTAEAREEQDRRNAVYRQAVAERDKALSIVRREWPKAMDAVTRVFDLMETNDSAIAKANGRLPDGATWIESVADMVGDLERDENIILMVRDLDTRPGARSTAVTVDGHSYFVQAMPA